MAKGYRILTVRHHTKLGQIDLVARCGHMVKIVEVKARHLAQAMNAVTLVCP